MRVPRRGNYAPFHVATLKPPGNELNVSWSPAVRLVFHANRDKKSSLAITTQSTTLSLIRNGSSPTRDGRFRSLTVNYSVNSSATEDGRVRLVDRPQTRLDPLLLFPGCGRSSVTQQTGAARKVSGITTLKTVMLLTCIISPERTYWSLTPRVDRSYLRAVAFTSPRQGIQAII